MDAKDVRTGRHYRWIDHDTIVSVGSWYSPGGDVHCTVVATRPGFESEIGEGKRIRCEELIEEVSKMEHLFIPGQKYSWWQGGKKIYTVTYEKPQDQIIALVTIVTVHADGQACKVGDRTGLDFESMKKA